MSGISTHVLDLALGKPAAGVPVRLEQKVGDIWQSIAQQATDDDGRCEQLIPSVLVAAATYRLIFETGNYPGQRLYPEVIITFQTQVNQNYHIPLLLSPNGYTTYRGS